MNEIVQVATFVLNFVLKQKEEYFVRTIHHSIGFALVPFKYAEDNTIPSYPPFHPFCSIFVIFITFTQFFHMIVTVISFCFKELGSPHSI